MEQETVTYRRTDLYRQVWAEPVIAVAKKYGVSNTALAKTCRRLAVPLPERGYWAKKKAGVATKQPPLPSPPKGVPEELTLSRVKLARTATPVQPRPAVPTPAPHPASTAAPLQSKIIVPATLAEPHRFVATAARLLRRKDIGIKDGIIRSPGGGESCLDVHVSPAQLDRALRVMDTLLKALEQRGFRAEITEPAKFDRNYQRIGDTTIPPNATRVYVDGEWLRFGLVERLTTREVLPPKGLSSAKLKEWNESWHPTREFVPKGILELWVTTAERLGTRTTWKDGKRLRVEDCLNAFIDHLPAVAQSVKDQRAEDERRKRAWEEEQRRAMEEHHRRWEEDRKAKAFEEQLARWRLAQDYRSYVDGVRRIAADAGCHITEGSNLDSELRWAQQHADAIDPLASFRQQVAEVVAKRARESTEATAAPSMDADKDGDPRT